MATSKSTKAKTGGVEAVEAYLAAIPEPARTTLLTVRETIRAVAPSEAVEEMGYGVPSFRRKDRLAGYAAGKSFCSYYPMSGSVLATLKDDLKGYTTTKGALQFPLDKPLSATLIKKLIRARLREIEVKTRIKAGEEV